MLPIDFLSKYENMTLTVRSTDDARRKSSVKPLSQAQADSVAIRYEEDTKMLFIDKEWLKLSITQEELHELQLNTQFRGTLLVRMLKGTNKTTTPATAFVFDLNGVSARRAVIDPKARRTFRNKLMREQRLSVPELARKMEKYDRLQEGLDHPAMQAKEELQMIKEQARRMLDEARRLNLGMNPKKRAKKKDRVPLIEIDDYTKKHLKRLIIKRNKKLVENRVPHIVEEHQEVREGECLGVYKEEAKLHSDFHEKKLYLLVSELKRAIPHYRQDLRYTTSHCVYIKERVEDGSIKARTIYCAVFDLKRK